ncbi:hypothetical protein FGO68_gene8973 [Halteria grandinella]|uniref:Uncharacterized protein n=1 Tax=Halteria grandinella TaxID=5974 RepID=A0A8J8NFM5_HALGN|nr:hypothetical protein FGO68_gene8973 [Halteria grandinella]
MNAGTAAHSFGLESRRERGVTPTGMHESYHGGGASYDPLLSESRGALYSHRGTVAAGGQTATLTKKMTDQGPAPRKGSVDRKQRKMTYDETGDDNINDVFEQILEDRDTINELGANTSESAKQGAILKQYYMKGSIAKGKPSLPQAVKDEVSSQKNSSDSGSARSSTKGGLDSATNASSAPKSKFNVRFTKHLKNIKNEASRKSSCGDDTSSATSHFQVNNFLSASLNTKEGAADDGFEFDDEGLAFDNIPPMSSDGMYNCDIQAEGANPDQDEKAKNNELAEDEHEDLVLDRGTDYKMVSIMRQKRPAVYIQGDDINPSTPILPTIEEEAPGRWTAALPKFGEGDYLQGSQRKGSQSSEGGAAQEQAVEESTRIHGHADNNWHRQRLMQRLAQNRIYDPTGYKPKTYQTMIIWDWDDTLMASTFLSPYQSRILEPNVRARLAKQGQQQLDQLQDLVIKLLRKSVAQGKTYIITNAGQGWVELSSGKFLPKLYKEIIQNSKQNGVNIISARALFEKQMPRVEVQNLQHAW